MLVCLLPGLLGGCGLLPEAARPTKTPVPTMTPTEALEPGEEASESAPTQPPRSTASAPAAPVLPSQATAEYDLAVQLDYDRRLVQVHQTIRGINPASEPLNELPLVVEANLLEGVFSPGSIRVGSGKPRDYVLDGRLVRVPLDAPLAPGAGFSIELTYALNIPLTFGWLSYTGKQLNLGDWYPFIPAYQAGKGFLIHNPGSSGEYLVYPRIDYHVELTLVNHAAPLVVAASAPVESVKDNEYTYTFRGGRTFAFSISPDFLVKSDGIVDIYYYAEHGAAADASLRVAKEAVELYSDLFAPYPYERLAVVEGDFFDGMEYTGLFFLGSEYFGAYPNSAQSYLTALSAHETAHQWWYGLVGNDPALEPWLDEALSTYSELFYYEKYQPDLVDWWWNYRVDRFDPTGPVNSTIYAYDGFRPYVNAVYLNGAHFLDEVRKLIGNEAFLLIIQKVAAHQERLITGDYFLGWLREQGSSEIEPVITKYFQ